jgi:DNA-binding protein YbaB
MDNSALRARTEELMTQFERARAGANDVRRRLLAIRGKAKSDDGYITVEVGHRGWVESIDIDPRVYRRPDSRLLAETITETIKKAVEDVQNQVGKVSDSYVAGQDLRAALDLDIEGIFRRLESNFEDLSRGTRE